MNKHRHLGTQITFSKSEMYSNSDKEKEKKKENTFQISNHGNVCAATPLFSPSEATPLGERDRGLAGHSGGGNGQPPIQNNNGTVRHLSTNDIYTDVLVQVGSLRSSDRCVRATAYINLIPDDSDQIEIRLRSSLTTMTDETLRSARDNPHLTAVINGYRERIPGVMLGRCQYKRVRGSYSSEFKSNIRGALLAVWQDEDGAMTGEFYCLGEYFPLQPGDLTLGQRQFYDAALEYHAEVGEID